MGFLNRLFGTADAASNRDRTESILRKHLDRDFRVSPMAEKRQSPSQVQSIGTHLGVRYPEEFSAHVCGQFPGIYIEVKEAVWPRPKLYDVGPSWSFLYAMHTFTSAGQSDSWMRLQNVGMSFQEQTGLVAAPVLRVVGDADVYCVNKDGQLVQFLHETNELEPVEMDFWALFDREVRDLRERKDWKKAGK